MSDTMGDTTRDTMSNSLRNSEHQNMFLKFDKNMTKHEAVSKKQAVIEQKDE